MDIKKIKNYKSIDKLIRFIIFVLGNDYNNIEHSKLKIDDIANNFIKIGERGAEIFQRPDITYLRNMGDCDDFTTLLCYIAHKKGLQYKIGFVIKENFAVHIYPIIEGILFDIWTNKKDVSENDIIYSLNIEELRKWEHMNFYYLQQDYF